MRLSITSSSSTDFDDPTALIMVSKDHAEEMLAAKEKAIEALRSQIANLEKANDELSQTLRVVRQRAIALERETILQGRS